MRPYHSSHRRRGTVTVIVVAFLMLMLILGLSFAFYALREAEESRVYRDAHRGGQTGVFPVQRTSSGIDDPPEPDTIVNRVLGDVIYGPPDDLTGAFNDLRQHEIARSMYGWNPKYPTPFWPFAVPPTPGTFDPTKAATQAFNGIGRVPPSVIGSTMVPPVPLPDNMISFKWVSPNEQLASPILAAILQGKMYSIDSNYAGDPRFGPPPAWIYNIPPNPPIPGYVPAPGGADRYWAKNADYTYPDTNNFFLGAIDPTSGKVLVQSYHRPWLIVNAATGAPEPPPPNPESETPARTGPTAVPPVFNPADPNPWTNATGRLSMLRPRPVDHQWPPGSGQSEWRYPTLNIDPLTGLPDGTYGDVELLVGKSIGRRLDAQWLDPDLPVRTWRGKNYKPLIAMLIVDNDSRINLNTAGNFYPLPGVGPPVQYGHGSHQGIGPSEVNPSKVLLNYPLPPLPPIPVPNINEAAALTLGTQNPDFPGVQGVHARYGLSWWNNNPPNPATPIWAPIKQYWPYQNVMPIPPRYMNPFQVQQIGTNQPPPGSGASYYGGVDFDARGALAASKYSDDDALGHGTNIVWGQPFIGQPGNPLDPPRPNPTSRFGDGIFLVSQTGAIIYDERSHHPGLYNPYLLRPRPWIDKSVSLGRVIPNRVFGVDELRNLTSQYNYSVSLQSDLARLAPSTLGNPAVRQGQVNSRFVTTTLSNEIDLPGSAPTSIQNYLLGPATQPTGQAQPVSPNNPVTPNPDYDDSFRTNLNSVLGPVDLTRKLTEYRADLNKPFGGNNVGNVVRAIADRQMLAHDIFVRLRKVTNAPPIAPGDATNRWLAQVAVNIVDFIDSDDCITPFKWTSQTGGGSGQMADDLTNEDPNSLTAYKTKVQMEWVFGFERPRVNINEAYLRVTNDPADPLTGNMATMPFDLTMWLELHNPLTPASPGEQFTGSEGYSAPAVDDATHGGYRAPLKDTFMAGEKSIYRVLISKVTPLPGNQDPMGMKVRDNVAGVPATPLLTSPMTGQPQILVFDKANPSMSVVDDSGGTVIQPNLTAQYRDQSFYLAGPQLDQQGGMGKAQIPNPNPQAFANLTSTALQAKMALTEFVLPVVAGGQPQVAWVPGFVLQRLACPGLPPGPLNPYVTIDYWDSDPAAVNNRLKRDQAGTAGDPANAGMEPDWMTTYAWGRRQPYDGVVRYDQMGAQYYKQAPMGAAMGQINFTFGQHNGTTAMGQNQWPNAGDATLQLPFRPLAHYDRIVLNPGELFQVVGTRPHEFTHEFCGPPAALDPNDGLLANGRLKYTVDWLDHGVPPGTPAGSFLWRALGLLRTPTHMDGLGMGGRVPGKININTIFNQQVFEAVCDAQAANRFTQTDVQNAWNALVGARHPAPGQITANDKPFRGYALSVDAQTGRGNALTRPDMLWSESNPTKAREFYAPGPSPAGHASAVEKYEMVSKVMNQFTTRSNCFTVYMMIGYFEVRNPGPWNEMNRPVLGKELGSDDGTVTRHRYFAVIDRTNLSIEQPQLIAPDPTKPPLPPKQGQPPVYFSYQPQVPLPAADPMTGAVAPVADPQTQVQPPPMGGMQVNVKIPAIGKDQAGGVLGYYDGNLWTIRAGVSQFVIDVGDRQEIAQVVAVDFDPVTPPPGGLGPDQLTDSAVVRLQLSGTLQHDRGAIMRLMNPDPSLPPSVPGNPGPQPGFNYKSSRYAPVIKYVEQLK